MKRKKDKTLLKCFALLCCLAFALLKGATLQFTEKQFGFIGIPTIRLLWHAQASTSHLYYEPIQKIMQVWITKKLWINTKGTVGKRCLLQSGGNHGKPH